MTNLLNRTFGRLKVMALHDTPLRCNQITWVCKCECGNIILATSNALLTGNTRSCGCLQRDRASEANRLYKSKSDASIATILTGIKARCYRKTHKRYKDYGGRGIYVCQEWLDNPLTFVEWMKDNHYRKGLSVDRINNDGPYSPDNCRIATVEMQANNKRNNHLIEINGVKKTLAQWSKEIPDCGYADMYGAIRRYSRGHTDEETAEYIAKKLRS